MSHAVIITGLLPCHTDWWYVWKQIPFLRDNKVLPYLTVLPYLDTDLELTRAYEARSVSYAALKQETHQEASATPEWTELEDK